MQPTWNVGGWFGPQLGATAWIGVAGVMSLFHDVRTGLVVLVLFLATNAVGWQLWKQRERRSYYGALKLLLVIAGVSGLLTVFAIERAGHWEAIQSGATVSAGFTYGLIVALIGGLVLLFHMRSRDPGKRRPS